MGSTEFPTVTLSEVADIALGKMLDATDTEGEKRPYLRNENVQWDRIALSDLKEMHFSDDEVDQYRLRAGDLLVCEGGEPGRCAVCTEQHDGMLYQKALHRVRPTDDLEPRYLMYLLRRDTSSGEMEEHFTGSTIQHLTLSRFQDYEFPLPTVSVQRQIVAKLDGLTTRADRARIHLERIPDLADKFKKSLLADAFSGELTREWREQNPDVEPASELLERIRPERRRRWVENYAADLADRARKRADKKGEPFDEEDWQAYYEKKIPQGEDRYEEPEPVDPDDEDLPEIPETWEWVRIKGVGEVQLGKQRSPDRHTGSNMVPYLRVANVFEERIDTSDLMRMHFSESDEEKYKLKEGDILLNEGQSPEFVGRPAIYRGEVPEPCCFTNTLIRYRPYEGLLPEFALVVFRAYMHNGRFAEEARITTNIAHLGSTRFSEMEFPLPPIDEQNEIANKVKERSNPIDRLESKWEGLEGKLHTIDKSMMKEVFSGA